jgi:hypothetical protein
MFDLTPHPAEPDPVPAVEAHLTSAFGEPAARAAVTFVGTDRMEVLRFGPDETGIVRYATLGMSRAPMTDPAAALADPVRGPRAELVLSVSGSHDSVLRPLAVFAASPQVEGLVVAPGASLDVGGPLWDGAAFTAVLVAEPGGLVADLPLPEPAEPVRFLPLLPMTAAETAWKRVHGAEALRERWLRHGTDLRDPNRKAVPLGD